MTLEEVFSPGGLLDRNLPNYEFRPSQLRMAEAVLDAIQNHGHLLVEAGTGTGKTLAYLVPAASCQKRVIISTATKNLQEQLFFNDLPLVRKILFPQLKAVCLKGRQNYLCLKRFRESVSQPPMMKNSSKDVLEGISSWVSMTRTGDRSELDWLADDDPNWSRLDARSDHCIGQKCTDFKSCYITRIRQKAFESDVLIINHALYFSNLALESDEIGRILPDHAVLILDEAHEIEDIAGNHFGRKLSSFQISDLCRRLYSTFHSFPEIQDSIAKLEKSSLQFFGSFPGPEGKFSLNLFRDSSNQLVDLRYELGGEFDLFIDALKAVYRHVDGAQLPEEEEKIYVRRLDRILEVSEEIFNRDDTGNVYWFEKSDRGVQILMTPVLLSPILRREVFEKVDSAILASATLTTQGGFEYIRNRLGLEDAEEEIVPGEFDYVRQTVLYIPVAMPQIGSGDYEESLLKEIQNIIRLTGGDAFLLFTSYRQMNFVYAELKKNEQFVILKQGEMPKTKILDVFKSTPGSVLCATSSFWQGVDVQGPALKAVVIDKLPFQVPTEPLVAARLRDLEERGEDGFNNYSVPNAIISLKQGLGRLIRSKKDYGVLVVLDSRIWERKYGLHFLNSLPNCPVTDNIGDLENFFARIVSNTSGEWSKAGC